MRRFFPLLALICAVALIGTACKNTKDSGFPPPVPETTKETTGETEGPVDLTGPIDVTDNTFAPKIAKVKAGTKVVWEQSGSAPHSVTADDDKFDSHPACKITDLATCMKGGDAFEFTFATAGEYPYFCVIHGSRGGVEMAGVIIVE